MTHEQFSQFMREAPEWTAAPSAIRAVVRRQFAVRPSHYDFEDLARQIVISVHGPRYAARIGQIYGQSQAQWS